MGPFWLSQHLFFSRITDSLFTTKFELVQPRHNDNIARRYSNLEALKAKLEGRNAGPRAACHLGYVGLPVLASRIIGWILKVVGIDVIHHGLRRLK